MPHTIQAGQVYRPCRPYETTPTLRITAYQPGAPCADAVDADTGRSTCVILTDDLHPTPYTETGDRRLDGFTLTHP